MRAWLLALALAATAPAAAADWYGGLHVGTTRAASATIADRVEGAYGVGVGHAFSPHFATQLDWHTLGENADLPTCPLVCAASPAPEHGWALRALPRLPLGERFALELGLGLMRWEGDVTYGGARTSAEDLDPLYSFAAVWRFAARWSLTVETQVLEAEGLDFTWTGATLRHRF